MYSEIRLTKDHDPADSTDTESLLSEEQSQEKLLNSLPSPTSRRNRRIKTFLHIAAILFYGVVTVLLYTWSIKLKGEKCECENAAVYCEILETPDFEKIN